jgi:D-glycero-D-manno-heptose 1,7-bisphosphate phosphatase
VFLDRDGVLIRTAVKRGLPTTVHSPEAIELFPDTERALERLRAAGLFRVLVTNQPDVARGLVDRRVVEVINTRLRDLLGLDDVRVCYHDDTDTCRCRKPQPGMLEDAAEALGIDLAASFMVGDRWRDVGAGKAAGCTTIWIDRGYVERDGRDADYAVSTLFEAVDVVLSR